MKVPAISEFRAQVRAAGCPPYGSHDGRRYNAANKLRLLGVNQPSAEKELAFNSHTDKMAVESATP